MLAEVMQRQLDIDDIMAKDYNKVLQVACEQGRWPPKSVWAHCRVGPFSKLS